MLRIDDIDVYYGPVQALRGVSLDIEDGEMVALLGANGAGKTTTLRAISGMVNPKRGSIWVDDVDVAKLPAHEVVGLGVAQMPQGRELFPELTVLENLRLGHWSRRKEHDQLEGRIEEIFEMFPKLRERATQAAGTMSGGEQQMLTVGRALMSKPKLLLVDEASLGLAPIIVQQLYEVIAEVNEREGTSVLLVDQFVHLALKYCGHAYVLDKGAVATQGPSQELLNSPELMSAYLGEAAPAPAPPRPEDEGRADVAAANGHVSDGDLAEVMPAAADDVASGRPER